jgi:hypothetical protein
MDLEALELYLQVQYIPAPWTIYKHVRKLLLVLCHSLIVG